MTHHSPLLTRPATDVARTLPDILITPRGATEMTIDASVLLVVDLASLDRSRSPRARLRQGNLPGWHYSPVDRAHRWFESLEEMRVLRDLACDPSVRAIASQPCRLNWPNGHYHFPDFIVERRDGRREIVNVRADERRELSEHLFQATAAFAEAIGMQASVRSGIATPRNSNVAMLHHHLRLAKHDDTSIDERLSEPRSFRSLYSEQDSSLVSAAWRGLALGVLSCDMESEITDNTIVSRNEAGA